MDKMDEKLIAIAEQQLGETVATWAELLSEAQTQGWFMSLRFEAKVLHDALFVLGSVAKRIGYDLGEVTDSNLTEKMESLVLAVTNIVGKDYLFPPKIEINK